LRRSAAGAGLIVGGVLAVILIAAGSIVTYLDIAQPPSQSQTSVASRSTSSTGSGYDIGGSISGAFSMLHDAIVKTETVTSTTTQQITSEKTILSTVVSSTTQFSTLTQTSVTTSTSTTSVYALPMNVTVLFTNIDGNYTYDIQAGSSSTSGGKAGNSPYSLQLTGLFQGQTVTITAATTSAGGCRNGEHLTMQLWVNGQIVAQSDTLCGDGTSGARITYTV
jgi:hypothetical protein